jgi:hypothetical protein
MTSNLPKETTFLRFITQKYAIKLSKAAFQCKFDVLVELVAETLPMVEKFIIFKRHFI